MHLTFGSYYIRDTITCGGPDEKESIASPQKQRSPVSYDIELLKVAATYSPTTQCSTIGDAVSRCCPLRSALSRLCPLRSLSRASDAVREGYGATHSWDIKDMVSLKKVSLFFERPLGARGYSRACCVLGSLEAMN